MQSNRMKTGFFLLFLATESRVCPFCDEVVVSPCVNRKIEVNNFALQLWQTLFYFTPFATFWPGSFDQNKTRGHLQRSKLLDPSEKLWTSLAWSPVWMQRKNSWANDYMSKFYCAYRHRDILKHAHAVSTWASSGITVRKLWHMLSTWWSHNILCFVLPVIHLLWAGSLFFSL